MMKPIFKAALSLAALAGASVNVCAQDAPIGQIHWQVEDRFRFFSKAETFKPHEDAARTFANIKGRRDEFGRKKSGGEWVGPVLFAERRLAKAAIKARRDGWAASADFHGKGTCWNSATRMARQACLKGKADTGSRLFPTQVRISATLAGPGQGFFRGKQCRWHIHTRKDDTWRRVTEADCIGRAAIPVPVGAKFSLLAQVLDPASPRGVSLQVSALYQQVRHKVIVGLGDSYASGEGNPDVPAGYSEPHTLADSHRPRPSRLPHWLDSACHRSVYSHQQRVAMQLAAESSKSVVTYLGYACSGASISHIMNGSDTWADHVEPVTKVGLRDAGVREKATAVRAQAGWSQLDQALRDLCADKGLRDAHKAPGRCGKWRAKPDLVLLSAGGNDVGFANVIKWAVAGSAVGKVRFLTGAEKPETIAARAGGTHRLGACNNGVAGQQCSLAKRYVSLAAAIENKLHLRGRHKVLIGPYPEPLHARDGTLCREGPVNDGADSEYFVHTSDDRIARVQNALFQHKTFHDAMKKAVSSTGWTWSDGLSWSGVFNGHGICAKAGGPANALKSITLRRGKWQPVAPLEMRAYASRQRWFRTFNDSVLMQFKLTHIEQLRRNPRQPVDYHYPAGISGFFHPTAEGQAAMADMLLPAARCILAGRNGKC